MLNILCYADPTGENLPGDAAMHFADALSLEALARRLPDISLSFFGPDAMLDMYCGNKKTLRQNFDDWHVPVHTPSASEMGSIFSADQETAAAAIEAFRGNFPDGQPNVVLRWGRGRFPVAEIFPDARILEWRATGIGDLEKIADAFPVFPGMSEGLKKAVSDLCLDDKGRKSLQKFDAAMRRYVLAPEFIKRETLDPDGLYRTIFFFAEPPWPYGVPENERFFDLPDFLRRLLSILPEDCAVACLSTPESREVFWHDFDAEPRVFDVESYQCLDSTAPVKVMAVCDAVISIGSHYALLGLILEKPVFGLGEPDWLSSFYSGSGEDALVKASRNAPKEAAIAPRDDRDRLLHFVLSRRMSRPVLELGGPHLHYLSRLVQEPCDVDRSALPPKASSAEEAAVNISRMYKLNHSPEKRVRSLPNKYDEIKAAMYDPKISTVVFKLFDVLICRKSVTPAELLSRFRKKIGEDASEEEVERYIALRAEAKKSVAKVSSSGGVKVSSLDDVYDVMRCLEPILDETLGRLRELELESEAEAGCFVPRKSGWALFCLAAELGKRIVVVEDTHLPMDFIKRLLRDNGYLCDEVWLSPLYNAPFKGGALLEKRERYGDISLHEALVVGYNFSDIAACTERLGLSMFCFPEPMRQLMSGRALKMLNKREDFRKHKKSADDLSHLYPIACRLYDNPFDFDDETLLNGSTYALGYFFYGPLVLGIASWLRQAAAEDGYDKIWFTSRDGYMVYRVYEMLGQRPDAESGPEGALFTVSRSLVANVLLDLPVLVLKNLFSAYHPDLSVARFLKSVFGANAEAKEIADSLRKNDILSYLTLEECDMAMARWLSANKSLLTKCFENDDSLEYWRDMVATAGSPVVCVLGGDMAITWLLAKGSEKRLPCYGKTRTLFGTPIKSERIQNEEIPAVVENAIATPDSDPAVLVPSDVEISSPTVGEYKVLENESLTNGASHAKSFTDSEQNLSQNQDSSLRVQARSAESAFSDMTGLFDVPGRLLHPDLITAIVDRPGGDPDVTYVKRVSDDSFDEVAVESTARRSFEQDRIQRGIFDYCVGHVDLFENDSGMKNIPKSILLAPSRMLKSDESVFYEEFNWMSLTAKCLNPRFKELLGQIAPAANKVKGESDKSGKAAAKNNDKASSKNTKTTDTIKKPKESSGSTSVKAKANATKGTRVVTWDTTQSKWEAITYFANWMIKTPLPQKIATYKRRRPNSILTRFLVRFE